jgi:hypothetical protein
MAHRPPQQGAKRTSYVQRRAAVAAIVLVLLGGGIYGLTAGGSKSKQGASTTTLPQHHHASASVCPLTGQPAPGGHVPQRPALAVKVGNEPSGARPQSGLDSADIVYDTPAEGYIMRYIAVFQCHDASSIGPTRSVRWVDWHVLQAFGHPILSFAGGIDPDVNTVDTLGWLTPANLLAGAASAGTRITSRVPPDNLYTSTAALWALASSNHTPPPAVFRYGASMPASAKAAAGLHINYSAGTDVTWTWDPKAHQFVHGYASSPSVTSPYTTDTDAAANSPVTATNVVVQVVHFTYGPYAESPGSTGDVESQTVGTGSGYVLRDGKSIAVTWHRAALDSPTTFTDASGQAVTLAPGRTFVELVLDTTASSSGGIELVP